MGNVLETFLVTVMRVAATSFNGTIGLDAVKDTVSRVSGYVLLSDAAKKIGVSRDRLLKAVKAADCSSRSRRLGTRGLVYEIPLAEIERVNQSRSKWVSQEHASEFARVPLSVLENMVAAKVINTDVKWRNDILKGQAIEKQSLVTLHENIKQHVKTQTHSDDEQVTWAELTSRRMGDKQAIQSAMGAAARGELVAVAKGQHLGQVAFLRSQVMAYFGTPILEAGMSVQRNWPVIPILRG